MMKSPYRFLKEFRCITFVDFVAYYEDAKAIGFSNKKAMKYAWECCTKDSQKMLIDTKIYM